MIEALGVKKSLLIAFALNMTGALVFAAFPFYGTALAALFILGIGMATLQVIINPLMRAAGGEENFAFFSVMGQLVFGSASFVSPFVFTFLMARLERSDGNPVRAIFDPLIRQGIDWTALYWIFSVMFLLMVVLVYLFRFPKLEMGAEEKSGTVEIYRDLMRNKTVWIFFLGIVAYVGTEQAIANWMSEFMKVYHGFDPELQGARMVGWFWGSLTIGCVAGLVILRLFNAKWVLLAETVLTAIVFALAVYGPASVAVVAFPLLGFCISAMYSIIFSTALNTVTDHPGAFSGILCSGIFGGALVPLVIGSLADLTGLRLAYLFVFITLGYIAYVAVQSRPLIQNKRM